MDLTKKERVLLINQYQILALLDSSQADHYEEIIEILINGFKIFYSSISEWLSDDMSENEGSLVLDVLSLYRAIESFKRRSDNENIANHPWGYFQGFDGNNEGNYMIFAKFLIIKQGKFAEQAQYLAQNDACNSHRPTVSKYENMIEKWDEYDRNYELSEDQVLKILNVPWQVI